MIKRLNKKIVLGVFALFSVIACITVSSFIPFTFDPEQIKTTKFITNEILICAITIISMVSTIFIGQASNAQNERSRLAKARSEFFASVAKIVNISKFFQWVKRILQPADIKAMYERKMREFGIEDDSVLNLEVFEIKQLVNKAGTFNGRYYRGLSKEQVKVLIKIKEGKYKVILVDPVYYITVKSISGNKTITEKSSSESKKKAAFLSFSIASKLIMTILIGMIFAALARDFLGKQDVNEALMNFGSRMFALVSSAFMGYIVGCQINDIDAEYIEMRTIVHKQFLQDETFVEKTNEELAKEEFEKENPIQIEEINNGSEQTQIEQNNTV